MNRVLSISLGFLVVMSSLGHVLAAAFCPHGIGHDCCFASVSGHTHNSTTPQEVISGTLTHDMESHDMDGMSMDDLTPNGVTEVGTTVTDVAMEDMATTATLTPLSQAVVIEEGVANTFDQPISSCAHCLSHSGLANSPVSFVGGTDPAGKYVAFVPLPVSRLLIRAATTQGQNLLPKEHAPPGSSAPTHILISVFLI